MEEITIYKFQLESIIEALRITSNIHESSKGRTCHDRQVRQAYQYAKNALKGEKDIEVNYMKEVEADKVWVCNSCNMPNFTQSVPQIEIENELHACINCGCFEFHLKNK